MNNKIIICLLFFFICSESLATGPSWINANIYPISINENGDILCRTRYEANPIGAYSIMPVEYGLAIISRKNIAEYIIYKDFSTEMESGYEKAIQKRQLNDQEFLECETKSMSQIEINLRKQYSFTDCNVSRYKRDMNVPLTYFQKMYQLHLNEITAFGLKNGQASIDNQIISDVNSLTISYDFGKILVINIQNNFDMSNNLNFNYKTGFSISTELGEQIDVGYDIQNVTGIIFIDKD